jgi:FkbM family methyltransferase
MVEHVIAQNEYGRYALPKSSLHRPVPRELMQGRVYEPNTIKYMIENMGDGDVIHAGTYCGDFIPALSKHCKGIVWCFEPNNENYLCARKTVELNGLTNVVIFNIGLGADTDRLKLKHANNGKSRGGNSKIMDGEGDDFYEVNIESIDNIIPDNANISILQLDVEGFESEVLKGAVHTIIRCKPIIILETKVEIGGYNLIKSVHGNAVYHPEKD